MKDSPTSDFTTAAVRCGAALLAEPGTIHSAGFTYPTEQGNPAHAERVRSSLHLLSSAAAARRAIAADHTAATRRCVAKVFTSVRQTRGPLAAETVSVAALPDPLASKTPSVALAVTFHTIYRFSHPNTPRGDPSASNLGVRQDMLAFAAGATVVVLIDVHGIPRNASAKENRLLGTLYLRTRRRD